MQSNQYLILAVAIVAEVIATSSLTASQGFTRLVPSLLTVGGYAVAFVFLSLAVKSIPTGVVYAIWSGAGIVLISLVGWLWFKQSLDAAALVGMGLIVAGVVVINTFSKSVGH
jgi:small multidrug resistance pump